MDKIAVLIPCYNEAQTIEQVCRAFHDALPEAVIYVYDNNSTDGTAKIAADSGAVVRHVYKQGKGNVVRRMFREIDAECYVMVDGDGTYPAESAPVMVREVLEHQADMVIGDRLSSTYFAENKRPLHNFGNALITKCVNVLFGSDIKDVMTGYRAFSYDFVKTCPALSDGFEIETEMTIHAVDKGLTCSHQPIRYQDRPEGSVSKLDTFSDGLKILLTVFRLYCTYRPLRFFGTLAGILLLASLFIYLPFIAGWSLTEFFPCRPRLIAGTLLPIASGLSISCGLLRRSAARKNRQEFEKRLCEASERKAVLLVAEAQTHSPNRSPYNISPDTAEA